MSIMNCLEYSPRVVFQSAGPSEEKMGSSVFSKKSARLCLRVPGLHGVPAVTASDMDSSI